MDEELEFFNEIAQKLLISEQKNPVVKPVPTHQRNT